jgi:hypothetical protein
MHPLKVSAEFAAFTWFRHTHEEESREAAARYARINWDEFLPVAHEGLGRLLIRIAATPQRGRRPARRVLVTS